MALKQYSGPTCDLLGFNSPSQLRLQAAVRLRLRAQPILEHPELRKPHHLA